MAKARHNDWLNDFAEEAVSTVNNSNTGYSAEIDSSNPGSIIFYSPSGAVESNISIEVDRREVNAPQNFIGNNINPYAYPSLGGEGQSSGNSTATTICDGK